MRVIKDKALLLKVRNPQQITTVIPKSAQRSKHEVVVHWGVEEAQVLRNVGIKNVPSPIISRYKWPGLFQPMEHQKTTAAFLTLNKRAFCLSEQGTGKTMSAAWAIDYLMSQGLIRRALIVCPLSIMDASWRSDLFKSVMHRKVDIAHGRRRKEVILGEAEIVVTNYDTVVNSNDDLQHGMFDLIVADECTALKTATTARWKAFNKLVGPSTWLWMMTGTPAAQAPTDAFGLAKLVNPEKCPKFFGRFRDMVMYKVTPFKWAPRPEAKAIVHNILQPAIRFTKEECLDLPDIMYAKRRVELTAQQKKYYELMRKKLVIEAAGEQVTAANAAVKLGRLLQISCGAVYSDDGEVLSFDISNRYKVLMEVIEQTEHKVIVFVPFRHVIQILTDRLNKDGITAEIINGDVSPTKRTDIFQRFQTQPDPRVLVIQPQAAAHGVTLTAADTTVWWGPTSSVEIWGQANARFHRKGQQNKCTVVMLEGSFAEHHVYSMLENNMTVHSQILDLYKKIVE